MKWAVLSACFLLIIVATVIIAFKTQDTSGINNQLPTAAPQYYGSEDSVDSQTSGFTGLDMLSVTAKLVEVLPDTYTFFDDWEQTEYRVLKMRTIKLISGKKMADNFYFLVPTEFMTDFSLYDIFIVARIQQVGYEYHIMYNKTDECAERLDCALFKSAYSAFSASNFAAYDSNGNFDEGLWKSNDAWKTACKGASPRGRTLSTAEERIGENKHNGQSSSVENISGEAKEILRQIITFENGLYVPVSSNKIYNEEGKVRFTAVRYINGFATTDRVSIENANDGENGEYECRYTNARFDENDLKNLLDLTSAVTEITKAFDAGEIVPLHIKDYEAPKCPFRVVL